MLFTPKSVERDEYHPKKCRRENVPLAESTFDRPDEKTTRERADEKDF
jgi:hypothetical protein